MRQVIVPALACLLGITVGLGLYKTAYERPTVRPATPQAATSAPVPSPAPRPAPAPTLNATGWELVKGGHLREAQDVFLQMLALNPGDADALRGLVVVRRYIGGDNPATLRRQAAAYEESIKRGVETDEHYTVVATKLLLVATARALREVEAQAKPSPAPAQRSAASGQPPAPPSAENEAPATGAAGKPAQTRPAQSVAAPPPPQQAAQSPFAPKASAPKAPAQKPKAAEKRAPPAAALAGVLAGPAPPHPAAPRPSSQAPAAAVSPRAIPKLPAAVPAAQPAPVSGAPAGGRTGGLYMVRIGPLNDRDRASAVARQLAAGGYAATNVASRAGFRVVSEPLPRSAGQALAATLASRGIPSQVEALTGDTVQLLFGTFATQREAEAYAQRVGGQGYDAWVREIPAYGLQLGPYPESAVKTITGIVKGSAPDAAVVADPVASQASSRPTAAPPSASTPAVAVPAPRIPAPVPAAPAVTSPPAAAAPAAPAAPLPNGRYMVRVGPIGDRDRAGALAKQLAAGGYASATVTSRSAFRVVSEPLPRGVAESLVVTLAGRGIHGQVEGLTGDSVQIVFGVFGTQREAESYAQLVGTQGYDAWVREGTVYMVQVGPYPSSAVNAITGIVKSGAPDAPVTADPVP